MILAAASLSTLAARPAGAGTLPDGFIDEFLVLGPYTNVGRDNPGEANQAQDFLCDGETSEDNILPEFGLELSPPDAPGGCAKDDSSYTAVDPVVPTIQSALATGDLLNQDALHSPNEGVMGYAWVYVENVTSPPRALSYTMGIASDDGITVEVNRAQVFNLSIPRGYDAAGVIQNRFPVTLLPGGNLIQFKTFEGGGGWGLRARFEDSEACAPVLSGEGAIEVGIEPIPLATLPGSATRTIVTTGNTQADITVATSAGGATYSLKESFGSGWTVSNITAGGAGAANSVTWTNITAPSVSYRLSRSTDFSTAQGTVSGFITIASLNIPVGGDSVIEGGQPPFVSEVLLTPEFNLPAGTDGCTVTPVQITGNWLGDGDTITDANFVPEEGLEFLPAFGTEDSQATGLTDAITSQDVFWTVPGDALGSAAKIGVGTAGTNGVINYNAIYGDQNLTMNVAYFYAVNSTAQNPLVLNMGVGSDDSVGVRVNGHPYHTMQACRANNQFGDKFRIALDPGKNLVAIYTFENGGGFDLTVRFEDENGAPSAFKTTTDPAGYDPNPALHPAHTLPPVVSTAGIYSPLGFVTRFLVPQQVFDQSLTSNTNPGALPEDYISINGDPPDASNVFEGAQASFGSTGAITTAIRGASSCGFTPLVLFDGVKGATATGGDPGLFDGERFYGAPDNYSSSLFFFLNNKTGAPKSVFIGFASDDAASLYVNSELILEFLVGRGFGGANTIQTGPAQVVLDPGINLVQLSYTEGGGGSGARVAVYDNCTGGTLIDTAKVEVTTGGEASKVAATRTLSTAQCNGSATVTLTFAVTDSPQNVNVVENLPTGTTGSAPSKGTFNGAGTVLSFTGSVANGDTLTYSVSGASPAASYCSGTANGRPIGGQNTFRRDTVFCGDIADGIFIDAGGRGLTDDDGRFWSEDTLASPSQFLTSPNAATAQFGLLTGVDLDFDPFVTEQNYPQQVFPTERWNNGPIQYTITGIPNGNYDVALLFMEGCCSDACDGELEDPALSAGGSCRVFDALVNGVFPTNDESPFPGGLDGDQFSQKLAAGNVDRVATHLSTTISVTDNKIVVDIIDLGGTNPPENASIKAIAITQAGGPVLEVFHRGDADDNGALQLTDALRVLGFLFLGGPPPTCLDSGDADDNGALQLTDALRILGFLFLGGPPPSPPGPPTQGECGADPTTDDNLGCASYTSC